METEGTIHVLRLDRPTDPQPWTYDVTFAPSGKGGFLTPRKCVGLPVLEQVLKDVGIAGHRRDAALEEVREGRAVEHSAREADRKPAQRVLAVGRPRQNARGDDLRDEPGWSRARSRRDRRH
jgi:hypothetical protein